MGTLRVKQIKSVNNSPLILGNDVQIVGNLIITGYTTLSNFSVNTITSDNYAVIFDKGLSVNDDSKFGDIYTDGDILTESFYTYEGNLFASNDLDVNNNLNVTNDVTVTNNVNINNDLTVNNDVTVGGSLSATFLYGDGSNIQNLPIKNLLDSSYGYKSITQNSNIEQYFSFGENSVSLGDFNTSNANYGISLGNLNTSGAIAKPYTLGITRRHLVILDDLIDVISDFSTGNTITGITSNPVYTGITTSSITSTTVAVSVLSVGSLGCFNLKIRNLSSSGSTITYVDCCGVTRTLTLSGSTRRDICVNTLPTVISGSINITDFCAGPGQFGCTRWRAVNPNPFSVRISYYTCGGQINNFLIPANSPQTLTPCLKHSPWYQSLPSGTTITLIPTLRCCSICTGATSSIATTTIISSITTTTTVVNVPIGSTGCTEYYVINNAYNPINVEYGNCNTGFFTATTIGAYSTRILCSLGTPIIISQPWMTGYTSPVWFVTPRGTPCSYSAQVITTTAITYTSFTTYTTACTSTLVGYTATTLTGGVTVVTGDTSLINGRVGNVIIRDNIGDTYIGTISNIITGMTSGTTITGLTIDGGSEVILDNLSGGQMRSYAILYLDEEINNDSSYGYVVNSGKGRGSVASGIGTQAKGIASTSQNQSTLSLGDYSHSEGLGSISEGVASNAGGLYSKTTQTGEFARSSGMFSSVGDAQYSTVNMLGVTTGTTYSYLFVDGVSEKIKIQKNSITSISLQINATIFADLSGKGVEGNGAMFFNNDIIIKNNSTNNISIINGESIGNVAMTDPTLTNIGIDIVIGDQYSDYSEINFVISGAPDVVIRWNGVITMVKTIM